MGKGNIDKMLIKVRILAKDVDQICAEPWGFILHNILDYLNALFYLFEIEVLITEINLKLQKFISNNWYKFNRYISIVQLNARKLSE